MMFGSNRLCGRKEELLETKLIIGIQEQTSIGGGRESQWRVLLQWISSVSSVHYETDGHDYSDVDAYFYLEYLKPKYL